METYISLLRRNANYRSLWLARVISFFGDWFNLLASAALISSLTGSGAAVSYLFLARFLPLFFASPFAGVIADRFSRRKIMIASDLLRAATVLAFLLIRSADHIWLFYVLTALQFTSSAFFTPAQSAMLPDLVEREDLVTANALDGFTWSTMLAVGSMVGGLVAALAGIEVSFVLDSLTFLLSAWFVARIKLPSVSPAERTRTAGGGGLLEFVDGLRYLRHEPFILTLALVKAGGSLVWGAINVLEITLAEQVFPLRGSGTLTLGLIYGITGLGTGFGPLFLRQRLGDTRGALLWAITLGFALLSAGLLFIGLAPSLVWVLAGTLVRALGTGSIWVFSAVILQQNISEKFRGRVFAFEFAVLTLTQSCSTLWAGVALDNFGLSPQQTILTMLAVSAPITLGWALFQARLRARSATA